MRLVLASRNPGKVREARAILRPYGVEIVSLDECGLAPGVELEETGSTFEQNALQKARQLQRLFGGYVLADDSGLEVDALGGEPGVYSARYAGVKVRGRRRDLANSRKVLGKLEAVPMRKRTARFVCVMALVGPGRLEIVCRGVCEGRIGLQLRGENGFGYDPIFLPRGRRRTMAELSAAEKNAISHRGRALRALAARLGKLLAATPARRVSTRPPRRPGR